ncbi:phage portal protein [Helicobacter sp. 11S02629-2]|uniref:phage portal protein n=1 Tax=Helicobacter sp. 11S02629-2 TaxID=1476195 RepID=UPI0021516556|nr:phage portal protein [Helicobacter sp. 11S02629-2]
MQRLLSNIDINQSQNSITKQARHLSLTNSLLSGFLHETLHAEILGKKGMSLDMHTPNKNLNLRLENLWRDYCDEVFSDVEELTLLHLIRDGEAFIHINGTDLEVLDPLNIDHSFTNERENIYYGIKFDESLKIPLAYFFLDKDSKLIKLNAKNIIHIFQKVTANQVRGLSKLASIILPADQVDKFKQAEIQRARLQSEITGFFVSDEKGFNLEPITPNDNDAPKPQAVLPTKVEVGNMNYIGSDMKAEFINSHNPTNIEFFIKQTNRESAKALGISYSTLTGDLNDVNYSSIRYGGSAERRGFMRLQNFLIRKLHKPIFKVFLKNLALDSKLPPSQIELALNNFTFKAQGWEYIDPYKETMANKIALESAQKSLSDILREKGKELDSHVEELKKESEIYKILNENKVQGAKR